MQIVTWDRVSIRGFSQAAKVYRKESKTLSLGGKFSSSAGSFRTAAARSFSVAVQFAIGFNPQWLG
jgi:hypothetical protein